MTLKERVQRASSKLTFGLMGSVTGLSNRAGLPVLSTGRPFSFYRSVFFEGRSEEEVFAELHGKRVLDVGCGLTPFVPESFFQRCHAEDIELFGVDPKLKDLKFGWMDHVAVMAMRGRPIQKDAPGAERRIAAFAQDLPFMDNSVDLVLSSWLLYIWLRGPILNDILTELHRVLRPGGQVRISPTPWLGEGSSQWLPEGFVVEQRFHASFRIFHRPPAYTTVLTKTSPLARSEHATASRG